LTRARRCTVQAETHFELTTDPELEAGGWLRLSRDAIEGDAFPRARIGDLWRDRRPGLAGLIRDFLEDFSRHLARRLARNGALPWTFRT
jgi:hypothetical protein